MTTTERLQRIRTKCVELLEIAEKRTPGAWFNDGDLIDTSAGVISCDTGCLSENNARFIAYCAGNFERALRSTIAAIDGLLAISQNEVSADDAHACNHPSDASDAINKILAAWPEELL